MLDTSSCQKQSKLKVKPWMTPSILWSVGIKKKKTFQGHQTRFGIIDINTTGVF